MELTSVLLIRGMVAIAAGALAMLWPGLTVTLVVTLVGAYMLIDGIANGIAGLRSDESGDRSWMTVVYGIFGIGLGIVTLSSPLFATFALVFAVATWAFVTGALEIASAIGLRHAIGGRWLLLGGGILSVMFALLLFARPLMGAIDLAWALGIYAIAKGCVLITVAIVRRSDRVLA